MKIYISNCGKFGHTGDRCWDNPENNTQSNKQKRKFGKGEQDKGKSCKKKKKEETYEVEEEDEDVEYVTCNTEEVSGNQWLSFVDNDDDEGEYYNYNSSNTYKNNSINEAVCYYDWFGDSASSSHVMN